jgi:hypothetical protein
LFDEATLELQKQGMVSPRSSRDTGSIVSGDDGDHLDDVATNNNDDDDLIDPLFILYCNAKSEYWGIEIFDMLRRLLLTCFPIVFSSYGPVIVFSLTIALIALVYQQEHCPYLRASMNKVKMMENYQNILFIIVLLIENGEMFSNSMVYETAGVTLVVTNVSMFFIMLKGLWYQGNDQEVEEVLINGQRALIEVNLVLAQRIVELESSARAVGDSSMNGSANLNNFK